MDLLLSTFVWEVSFFHLLEFPKIPMVSFSHLFPHRSNPQNVQLVAKIAVQCRDMVPTSKAIEVLESFGTNEGVLFFLANVLPHTEDPEIYFKYIPNIVTQHITNVRNSRFFASDNKTQIFAYPGLSRDGCFYWSDNSMLSVKCKN